MLLLFRQGWVRGGSARPVNLGSGWLDLVFGKGGESPRGIGNRSGWVGGWLCMGWLV